MCQPRNRLTWVRHHGLSEYRKDYLLVRNRARDAEFVLRRRRYIFSFYRDTLSTAAA